MGRRLTLAQLLKWPIMMLDRRSTTSEFLHHVFQQHQLDLAPEIELSSNDLLIDLARIGLGIAFVPDFCIPKDCPDLFILDLEERLPAPADDGSQQRLYPHFSGRPAFYGHAVGSSSAPDRCQNSFTAFPTFLLSTIV